LHSFATAFKPRLGKYKGKGSLWRFAMQTTFDFVARHGDAATQKEIVVMLNPRLKNQRPCTHSQYQYIQDLCSKRRVSCPDRFEMTKGEAGVFIRKLLDLDFEDFNLQDAKMAIFK